MKKRVGFLVLAAVVLLSPTGLVAADADEPESVRGVIVLPVFGLSPEDGVVLGGAALFFWVPQPDAPTDTVSTNLFYGTKGTFSATVSTDHRVGRGRTLQTYLRGTRSIESYFGSGMDTNIDENFTAFATEAQASLLFPVQRRLSVGPAYRFSYIDLLDTDDPGVLAGGQVRGSDRALATGPGVRALFDNRDSNVYPTRGGYADFSLQGYPTWLGSSDNFWYSEFDARYFYSLLPDLVLGWQGLLTAAGGDIPFSFLPHLGGGNIMRGILEGRYRDDVALATQVEARFPIFWRFGGVAFFGAGTVAPSMDALAPGDFVGAGGLGLRFAVNPEQRLNIRFDVAYDGNDVSFYVNFQEAF